MKNTWISNLKAGALNLPCCGVLFGNAPLAQEPVSQKAARETLTVDLVVMMNQRTGGLDGDDRVGAELQSSGFYVDLEPWGYHVSKVSMGT